jgi:hypothetical protein
MTLRKNKKLFSFIKFRNRRQKGSLNLKFKLLIIIKLNHDIGEIKMRLGAENIKLSGNKLEIQLRDNENC